VDQKKQRNGQGRLMADERKQRILETLNLQGRLTVEELVTKLHVSAITVRADLDTLAGSGQLIRSRGGALKQENSVPEYPFSIREHLYKAEKQRIAKAAIELILPNQTILLDSGSTTMEIARQIRALKIHPLTVITNSLQIATELAGLPHISIVLPGGILRPNSYSMIGPYAERTLREMSADQAFLGVDSLDPSYGLCTTDMLGAQVDALMIEIAREVTIVADASKIGRRGLSVIAKISAIHRLITDRRADRQVIDKIKALGITVQLV
jgi:DeoR family transcriptional regulator, aga operon transcriptional repressor